MVKLHPWQRGMVMEKDIGKTSTPIKNIAPLVKAGDRITVLDASHDSTAIIYGRVSRVERCISSDGTTYNTLIDMAGYNGLPVIIRIQGEI